MKKPKVTTVGDFTIVDVGTHLDVYEIAGARTAISGTVPYFTGSSTSQPMRIGEYQIVPHGDRNDLPTEIREVLDENHITPELLNKQTQLLWGQGPALYRILFKDGKRVKEFIEDKEISAWLKSWDWEDYLLKSSVEFRHMNGHYTKFFRNKGVRIGGDGKITHLEHISSVDARLLWPEKGKVEGIIVGDFARLWKNNVVKYPLFDRFEPFKYPVAMRYSNLYSFALDNDYSRPAFYGILNWIKLSSSLPKLLIAFNTNSASIRHHIKIPEAYWTRKKEMIKKNCELKGVSYTEDLFLDHKNEVYEIFTNTLSGNENAGKVLFTDQIFDGNKSDYVDFKVETIDQKVKDFIDAQLEIAKRSDFDITAGIGLHPALSNMSADGNLPSGSEQLYAFKLYLSTGVDIPESIVCKDINLAIDANFPGKNLKIGFYHDTVTTEEMTTPKDRIKNQK